MDSSSLVDSGNHRNKVYIVLAASVAGITLLLLGFFGGVHYQKSISSKSVSESQLGMSTQGENPVGNGQAPMMRGGAFGEVKEITDMSISIIDQRSSSVSTYSITGETSINKNDNSASASDISIGDTVMIQVDSNKMTEATIITINPQMPSRPGNREIPDNNTSL